MVSIVREGQALGLLSCEYGYSDDQIIPCLPPAETTQSKMMLVISKDAYRKQITREFIKFVVPRFRKRLDDMNRSMDVFNLPMQDAGRMSPPQS